VADCHRFCLALAQLLHDRPGVSLRFGTGVLGIEREGDRVTGVRTDAGVERADAVVVAGGIGSVALLKPLGVQAPLWPLKGYSITVPISDGERAPHISVTDFARKIVYARIGNTLRVAGMADLVRADTVVDRARIATLAFETRALFGDMAPGMEPEQLQPWAGLRPATPTGLPMVGRSGLRGLWLNIGHGALGFTLAMGSAGLLADGLAGRKPAIDDADFAAMLA